MSAARTTSGRPPNNLAIVSLVAGILGLTLIPFVGSIVAIVTALAARRELGDAEGPRPGEGMATAGLVLGIAGVVVPLLAFCALGTLVLFPICLATLFTATEAQIGQQLVPWVATLA